MKLAIEQWGTGDRVAILLHGMAGSARTWWHVGPLLATRGYRVLAVDFPGHGRSDSDPDATPDSFVDALARSVPNRPRLALGHSVGGSILARSVAARRLEPAAAVYVETPFSTPPLTVSRDGLHSDYTQRKASRTEAWYRQHRPAMAESDVQSEADASRTWDIDTATSLSWHAAGGGSDPGVRVPSLVIRAEPSDVIDADAADDLVQRGFGVCSMPGAGHDVWHGRESEFVELITEWLGI